MDFGLAQAILPIRQAVDGGQVAVGTSISAARSGLAGTLAYMAPEQIEGGEVTPASDIYALGVVLYQVVTGTLPFQGDTPWEMALQRLSAAPLSPCTQVPDLDARWESTILRCLARTRDERFSRAEDVAAVLAGRCAVEAVVARPPRPPCHLPTEPEVFIGRNTVLETLHRRLTGGERLVTLLGTAGIGKTRLAVRYGWQHLDAWPGGVTFCDLSEARSVEGVVHAVASALGVPLDRDDPVRKIGHALAGRGRSLMILDNFEQVAAHAVATLGVWLEQSTETSFVATSRERLGLAGETPIEVEPLDPVTEGPALFEARARVHRPEFVVSSVDRPTLREIIELLDGLPLAIELAASRLRVLGLGELRDRLVDRLALLTGGRRGRHETLRAALDGSWELLEVWERSAVAQASVFDGGFVLEAAEAVIELAEWPDAPPVLDVVQSLVDKSWLRARVILGAPRFSMFAIVQEYAAEKLRYHGVDRDGARLPSADEVERRHGAYYAAMGTSDQIESGSASRWAEHHQEINNLVAACRRSVRLGDSTSAMNAFAAVWNAIGLNGHFEVAAGLGRLVLGMIDLPPVVRARALWVYGVVMSRQGRADEALRAQEEALALYRDAGDRRGEGLVLGMLGLLHFRQGRIEIARRQLRAALAIHREAGNRWWEGIVLGNLGGIDAEQGRLDEGRRCMEEALVVHHATGNRRDAAIVLANLAGLDHFQGRTQDVVKRFKEALAIHRELGHRHGEAVVLDNMGALLIRRGQLDEARRRIHEALGIFREIGEPRWEALALGHLAGVGFAQGRTDEARRRSAEGVAVARDSGERSALAKALSVQAEIDCELDHLDDARAALTEAQAITGSLGVTPDSQLARAIDNVHRKLAEVGG
jgi:predicted ATPase